MKKAGQPVLVLFLICVVASAALAFTYSQTYPRIVQNKKEEREKALREVLPQAEKFKEVSRDGRTYYQGLRDSALAGSAFIGKGKGYGGEIELLIGTDGEGRISGISVLNHTETPGLGARIEEKEFLSQFKGKTYQSPLAVKGPKADIDVITGATVSSQSVVGIVKNGLTRQAKDMLKK